MRTWYRYLCGNQRLTYYSMGYFGGERKFVWGGYMCVVLCRCKCVCAREGDVRDSLIMCAHPCKTLHILIRIMIGPRVCKRDNNSHATHVNMANQTSIY